MADPKNKSIMRSLGEFCGHVWKGVTSDPSKGGSQKRVVRHDVEERDASDEQNRITLRKTTIEEVEIEPREGR
jgi:hypothetical protein